MSKPTKSLYDILGVAKTDNNTAIKKAYFKLARIHHPDKGGNPELFKEISKAYEILTDDNRRKRYDDFGVMEDNAPEGGPPGFPGGFPPGGFPPGGFPFPFEVNLNGMFGNMFGGGQKGMRKGKKPAPVVQNIGITLEQFYLGHNVDIHINRQTFCKDCDHSGAKVKEMCKNCGGQGAVSQIVQMGPMSMHTTGPCAPCQGKGEHIVKPCEKCNATGFMNEKRNLSVKVIPGMKPNEMFVFHDVCSDNHAFESPGDVHIMIHEDPNDAAFKRFMRKGDNLEHLETRISLTLSESLIGCVIQLDGHPGYDEGLFLKIPPGSFQNDKLCLSGFGMPVKGHIAKYGDLHFVIDVTITPQERKLFSTRGYDALSPLFEEKVRKTVCPESAVIADLYFLQSK